MLSARWIKILSDVTGNRTRTFLISLSIGVGLFAVGTIVAARSMLDEGMAQAFAAVNPSSGIVRTMELFDEGLLHSVRHMDGVAAAEARRIIDARVLDGNGKWNNLAIFAVNDFEEMQVNRIWAQSGAWPPPEQEILIERAALPLLGVDIGDTLLIETSDQRERNVRVAGTVHDAAQVPAQFDNSPYGYVSMRTLSWFGESYGFNELDIAVDRTEDTAYTQQVINAVKDKVERNGFTIPLSMMAEPGQLPLDDILQAVLLLMGAIGLLSLFLSVFLIINTVSAIMAQQKHQIGIMKAVGADTGQLLTTYLITVSVYGLLALMISVPLSLVGARALSRFLAAMFNFDLSVAQVPPTAILLQVGIGLIIPAVASLYPLLTTLQVMPAEAISVYQLGQGRFGMSWLDRRLSGNNLWFARSFLQRTYLLSLRNTFRNKTRLGLTLITLTLAGAIFVAVFSVSTSVDRALDGILSVYNFDAIIHFDRPYRMEKISRQGMAVDGIDAIDSWLQLPARRVRPDGTKSETLYLFAPRAGSPMVPGPPIAEGRWLLPEDENAIVVDAILLQKEPDIHVGDEILFKIDGKERPFRVVGLSLGIMAPIAYANYPYIAHLTGHTGEGQVALIAINEQMQPDIAHTINQLENQYERNGLNVELVGTIAEERADGEAFFGIIVSLLMIMAVLLALVGGLGLMGTVSINVLERTREIGVLRAIGAPNRGVTRIFVVEGIAVGIMSWVLGGVFAIPLGQALCTGVGMPIMGAPLAFSYSLPGLGAWLLLVIALSALASMLPARRAAQLTVREVLAYE